MTILGNMQCFYTKQNPQSSDMGKFSIIWIINSFALGITLPVMTPMLLEKGASLSSLALFMGLYSAVVVGTEVHSGIFADKHGRKLTFLLAKSLAIIGSLLLVLGDSVPLIILSVIFLGFARSFSSGSCEALTIDCCIAKNDRDALHSITTRISIWETIGLSLGSLCAGFATLGFERLGLGLNRYTGNYVLSMAIQLAVILCTYAWVAEPSNPATRTDRKEKSSSLFSEIRGNRTFISLLFISLALGFALSAIEKYWQPRLFQVAASDETASILLGIVSFIGFAGALGGSLAAGNLLKRYPDKIKLMLVLLRILMALGLIALTTSTGSFTFILWYGASYLMLGMGTVAEQTLLNQAIPSKMRASLLSVSSFFLQAGGLLSSLFSVFWFRTFSDGINSLWIIAAGILALSLIPLARTKMHQQ